MNIKLNSMIAAIVLLVGLPAAAQQPAHTMPKPQPTAVSAEQVSACVQSQQQAMAVVDEANRRLEIIRQKNDQAFMREAVDEFQTALSAVRARLAGCAQLAAAAPAAMPMGHAMPESPPMKESHAAAPGTPAMPSGAMPGAHAGHAMPAAGTDSPLIKDPRCLAPVDALTAPRASYEGRNYYFCSESDRQRFVADPAKYLGMTPAAARAPSAAPKPSAADPHAGHEMPGMKPAAATPKPAPNTKAPAGTTKPPASDPHAGHDMSTMKPAAKQPDAAKPQPKPAAPAAKPPADAHAGHDVSTTKPAAKPAAGEKPAPSAAKPPAGAHAGHDMSGMQPTAPAPDQAVDPVCGLKVDKATAPKATVGGQTHYFCGEKHQQLFQKDPAKYVPKGR